LIERYLILRVVELKIKTPSRLHLTLIDLNGTLGRIDGGVGITIEDPHLVMAAEPEGNDIRVLFKESGLNQKLMDEYRSKMVDAALKITKSLNLNSGYIIKVLKTYPPHSGLGFGTQLSLAVGKLIAELNGQDISAVEIAQIVGRGGTSGIGVASFETGGFIVDGGHKKSEKLNFLPSSASKASPPPITARYDFPDDWKIILVIPQVERNVSGEKEVNIFQEYCPIPLPEVQKLSHILLMNMMPAVVEGDLDAFGSALNSIQNIGFKKIEVKLQNQFIKDLMDNLRSSGAAGVGMSSFGPTVYAITDNSTKNIISTAKNLLKDQGGKIILSKAQNDGAIIHK
jgi:beta-ribofuranosylaminobenzene 5'-phosphate synthase